MSTLAKNAETVSPSPSPTDLRKLPTNKKVKKEDLNAELVNHVMHTSKTSLFRTCKFIEDVEEEKDVTREIIPLLPVKLEIPEDEFVEKYKGIVYDGIKAGRTDVQSNGKKRAQGTSNICKNTRVLGNYKIFMLTLDFYVIYAELFDLVVKELGSEGEVLPTCDEILELLSYSVDHFENPENALDKKKLLWYQDRWLPIAIGLEYWDDKNRHYDLPTDTLKMRDGVDRLLCTATSEAFGLMVYDNCRDKWEAIMKLKAENKGKYKIVLCKFQSMHLPSFLCKLQESKFHVQDPMQQSMKPSGLLPRKARRNTEDGPMKHTTASMR